jgi:hypothetical protein
LDLPFSKDFKNGDSIALGSYYCKDGRFGSLKGKDIIGAWGGLIRKSIQDSTRNLVFTTTAFMGDSDFFIEMRFFEFKDDMNSVKDKGKFLVVLKLEDGKWKMYRDMGL